MKKVLSFLTALIISTIVFAQVGSQQDYIHLNERVKLRTQSIDTFSTDGTLSANSDFVLSTQKAIKTYLSTHLNAKVDSTRKLTGTDSVFEWRNGVATFVFKDSAGGGGGGSTRFAFTGEDDIQHEDRALDNNGFNFFMYNSNPSANFIEFTTGPENFILSAGHAHWHAGGGGFDFNGSHLWVTNNNLLAGQTYLDFSNIYNAVQTIKVPTVVHDSSYLIVSVNGKLADDSTGNISTVNLITYSKAQLDSAIGVNGLIPGLNYLITGVNAALYGGTDVILKAASTNKLEQKGSGFFYNPKYDQTVLGYGIWSSTGTYSIGDKVIWGGKVWSNNSGNVGTNDIGLGPDFAQLYYEWSFVAYNTTDYNYVNDPIEYDYVNDLIVYRHEVASDNEVRTCKADIDVYAYTYSFSNPNPIQAFQWGNGYDVFTTKGVGNNHVINSYVETVNILGSLIYNNTFTLGTIFMGNSSNGNLVFQSNVFEAASAYSSIFNGNITLLNNRFINGAGMSFHINGTSDIYGNLLNGSYVQIDCADISFSYNDLSATSIYGITSTSAASITNNKLSFSGITGTTVNNSQISNNHFDHTNVTSVVLNDSYLNNNVGNQVAIVQDSLLNGSYVQSCNFNGGQFYENRLDNTQFNNIISHNAIIDFAPSGLLSNKIIENLEIFTSIASNISAATDIYNDASKQYVRLEGGSFKLVYFNSIGVQTLVDITH